MDWAETIIEYMKQNQIRVISYVPDAIVWRVLEKAQADPFFRMVRATREDEAVGVVAGTYMGGLRGAVFMQNSGLGNCINAFGSLCIAARIPVPMFINVRGELGEANLAQVPLGRALRPIMDAMGLQYFTPTRQDEVAKTVDGAIKVCYAGRLPVGVLLTTLLTGGKYAR
jgi:sulfopyruvate decarboxylase alpha subunit